MKRKTRCDSEAAGFLAPLGCFVPSTTNKEVGTGQRSLLVSTFKSGYSVVVGMFFSFVHPSAAQCSNRLRMNGVIRGSKFFSRSQSPAENSFSKPYFGYPLVNVYKRTGSKDPPCLNKPWHPLVMFQFYQRVIRHFNGIFHYKPSILMGFSIINHPF